MIAMIKTVKEENESIKRLVRETPSYWCLFYKYRERPLSLDSILLMSILQYIVSPVHTEQK